ncbi:hypothetical protein, unknown function [Leishmania tarentolae]|uniref:Leucine-rich repeat protein n=1 Tax=Leishmania tarentolae TaxID=5689 RepID=A0A640KP73_LEITA|nr:hypothetical protein, unknown function [Leishmania tarentolae]
MAICINVSSPPPSRTPASVLLAEALSTGPLFVYVCVHFFFQFLFGASPYLHVGPCSCVVLLASLPPISLKVREEVVLLIRRLWWLSSNGITGACFVVSAAMHQRSHQHQDEQHLQLSVNSLGAVASYWPSRTPLGFAAAHPCCRIAAEARFFGTYSHLNDAASDYEAVWTDWALQAPFGDWWVSDLAERIMPSERPLSSEVQFMDAAGAIVGDTPWYFDHSPNTVPAAANATWREGERRCAARPHPPGTVGASPWRHILPQRRARTYFEHKQQRCAAAAAAIAPGAAHPGLDSEHSLRTVSLPEYPFVGTSGRCAAMRAGYLGGVLVGHLVSFLVRSTAPDAAQYIFNAPSTVPSVSADFGAQEHVQRQWRRVLHWEVGMEREEEERRRRHEAAPVCSNACGDAAPSSQNGSYPGGSWMHSHWWLSRPLVLGRACAASSRAPCSGFAREDIRSRAEDDDLPQAAHDSTYMETAAPPSTSLYAYGDHPAVLPLCMMEGCKASTSYSTRGCRPRRTTSQLPEEATGRLHMLSPFSSCDGQQLPRCCSSFLSAVHLYECRVPPALPSSSLSATSDDPAHWWYGFLSCPCCAHLRILDVNFEGAQARKLEDWAMVAAPVRSAGEAVVTILPSSASPKLKTLDLEVGNADCAASDARSRRFPFDGRQLQPQTIASSEDCASSARPHLQAPVLRYVTEVHLTASETLHDIGFLGDLPALHLADVSFNASLTDAGVHGLCRSTSLRVIDVSYCPQVNAAAAELVRCLAELEELYLSGTGLTDGTLRSVLAHLRSSAVTPHDALFATEADAPGAGRPPHLPRPDSGRRLRVLHAYGCRRVRNPYRALTSTVIQPNQRRRCRSGGVTHVQSRWTGLRELRLSSVAMGELHHESEQSQSGTSDTSRAASEDGRSEVRAAAEHVEGALKEGAGLPSSFLAIVQDDALPSPGVSLPAVSSSSLLWRGNAALGKKTGAAAQVMTAEDVPEVLTTPLSFLWRCLTTLVFTDTKLRCALGDVGQLPALQSLSLRRCAVEEEDEQRGADEGARRPWLSGLEHSALLHTVHLDGCGARAVRDTGSLQILARLPSLQNISFSYTDIRDADLEAFVDALCEGGATAPQHGFHRLCLRSCGRLTNVGAVALLSSVRSLDLSDTTVRQEVLDALGNSSSTQPNGNWHALQALNCSACSFIVDLSPVAHLRHLRWLNASHTPLNTASVEALRFCSALTHLTLKNCSGVHHVRDVMSIATLEVLNVQGSGLYDEDDESEEEIRDAIPGGRHVKEHSRRRSFMPGTPPFNFSNPLLHYEDSQALEESSRNRSTFRDVFPGDDDVLFTSSLHTLLLSHTRVRRIRRLGLLPSLMCLDLSNTSVTDAELVKFVCTGMLASDKRESDARSALSRKPPVVVHSLRALRLGQCAGRGRRGPPIRLLSLQFCRYIFSVGVLGLCPHLTKLDVSSSNVTSQGLVGLHRSTSLVQMRLLSCKGVHDVRSLIAIPSLAEVNGSGCNVHSGRITGADVRGGSGTHAAEDTASDGGRRGAAIKESGGCLPPSPLFAHGGDVIHMAVPLLHSDLLHESGSGADDIAAVRRATEGSSALRTALLQVNTFLSSSLGLTHGCQRLVLDGCANICSFVDFHVLSSLLELSLCNCHGITAASVSELISLWPCYPTASGTASLPPIEVSTVLPVTTPFASLRTLRLSSCRNLTGSLAGLELLPKLSCVHVDRCGITSVSEVMPALRNRIVL